MLSLYKVEFIVIFVIGYFLRFAVCRICGLCFLDLLFGVFGLMVVEPIFIMFKLPAFSFPCISDVLFQKL